jgi:16S rRNA U516 pseudouridylate synthase RsuA-like enzyme
VRDPARDVPEDADVTVDGAPVGAGERREVHALNKPRGWSRPRTTRTAGPPSSTSCRPPPGCTRSGASTPTAPA